MKVGTCCLDNRWVRVSRDGKLTVLARREAGAVQIGKAIYEPSAGQLHLIMKERDEPHNGGRHGSGAMGTVKNPTTTDDELRCAIEAGRKRRTTERRAASVRYDPGRDAIEIRKPRPDGAGVRLPKAMVEEFRDVPPLDMTKLRVSPAGYGIRLDEHDINISVHGLIGALATTADMAGSLGKIGGAAKTEAKRVSTRANGAKGGRPRKVSCVA